MSEKIINTVEEYYSEKILKHGKVAAGVDCKNEEGQDIRFEQLMKLFTEKRFSLNDLGCGYGRFAKYIKEKGYDFEYNGYDVSEEMISSAKDYCGKIGLKKLFLDKIENANEMKIKDYTIASGIFNVKFNYDNKDWEEYVLKTIDSMNESSTKGFAFNILTKYSDKEYMKDNLYYADPSFYFDYCKRKYSKKVVLIHDYDLYEFTIIVRK